MLTIEKRVNFIVYLIFEMNTKSLKFLNIMIYTLFKKTQRKI